MAFVALRVRSVGLLVVVFADAVVEAGPLTVGLTVVVLRYDVADREGLSMVALVDEAPRPRPWATASAILSCTAMEE